MKDLFERAKESDVTILDDPDVSKIKDKDNWTPLHWLAWTGKIEVSDLKKLFPWYLRKKKGRVKEEEITEILNTPQAIQYILEED